MGVNNAIRLNGTVLDAPMPHHEAYGRAFYTMTLSVARLSGVLDYVPVMFARDTVSVAEGFDGPAAGSYITVFGEIRSYTVMREGGRHLSVVVFGRRVAPCAHAQDMNCASLHGFLKYAPTFRITPQGREITDMLIFTERGRGRYDAIPAVAWGRIAREAESYAAGCPIVLEGRFQSRMYQKVINDVIEERTAYEVSAAHLMKAEGTLNPYFHPVYNDQ